MIESVYEWLGEIEDNLSRMLRGVFRFMIEGLPRWVRRVVMETIGPVALRLCRVLVLFCLWLALLFCPLIGTIDLELPSLCIYISVTWLGLAIIGSLWGLRHLARKRKAALVRTENGDGCFQSTEQEQSRDILKSNPPGEFAFP